ncbi:GNAT family N-acetyltransferase [Candidatus Woesearchaeota archaeon]|nr:GNAT family N-acetyltransferase [Candidatus Woesearchaeota archaeon]
MGDLSIVCLREKDIPKLLPLIRRIYPKENSIFKNDNLLLNWVIKSGNYPSAQWYAAKIKDEIVGFTRWYLYDTSEDKILLMLSWTAVKKEYESKYISTKLLNDSYLKVRSYWKKKGLNVAGVWVETDTWNIKARHFYKHFLSSIGFNVKKKIVSNLWGKEGVVFIFGVTKSFLKRQKSLHYPSSF